MNVSKHKPIHIKLTFNQNQFSQPQLYQNQFSLLPNQTQTKVLDFQLFEEKSYT